MKIHFLDTDPRKDTDPSYHTNMGSFSIVAKGFNDGLKEIGCYSDAESADYVGICDGLNIGFKYGDKKTFVVHVWDCINTIPTQLINMQNQRNQKIFGLSNQITNLWKKYGAPCETTMPGCDSQFWNQALPKDNQFTFIFSSFANVRSGFELAINAFANSFTKNDNVKLIVKNTNENPQFKYVVDSFSKECNIEYIDGRISFSEIRDLYSRSHVSLNVMRHSSWGLNIHEAAACNCLPIIGDFCPSNEILSKESALFIKPVSEVPITSISAILSDKYGLHNAYGNFWYPENPTIYGYNLVEYSALLKNVYQNWNSTYSKINSRKEVVEQWSWRKAAENLYLKLKHE